MKRPRPLQKNSPVRFRLVQEAKKKKKNSRGSGGKPTTSLSPEKHRRKNSGKRGVRYRSLCPRAPLDFPFRNRTGGGVLFDYHATGRRSTVQPRRRWRRTAAVPWNSATVAFSPVTPLSVPLSPSTIPSSTEKLSFYRESCKGRRVNTKSTTKMTENNFARVVVARRIRLLV